MSLSTCTLIDHCGMNTHILVQLAPSSCREYPALQLHLNAPGTFSHSWPQLCVIVTHSSTSTNSACVKTSKNLVITLSVMPSTGQTHSQSTHTHTHKCPHAYINACTHTHACMHSRTNRLACTCTCAVSSIMQGIARSTLALK